MSSRPINKWHGYLPEGHVMNHSDLEWISVVRIPCRSALDLQRIHKDWSMHIQVAMYRCRTNAVTIEILRTVWSWYIHNSCFLIMRRLKAIHIETESSSCSLIHMNRLSHCGSSHDQADPWILHCPRFCWRYCDKNCRNAEGKVGG